MSEKTNVIKKIVDITIMAKIVQILRLVNVICRHG